VGLLRGDHLPTSAACCSGQAQSPAKATRAGPGVAGVWLMEQIIQASSFHWHVAAALELPATCLQSEKRFYLVNTWEVVGLKFSS